MSYNPITLYYNLRTEFAFNESNIILERETIYISNRAKCITLVKTRTKGIEALEVP